MSDLTIDTIYEAMDKLRPTKPTVRKISCSNVDYLHLSSMGDFGDWLESSAHILPGLMVLHFDNGELEVVTFREK